MHNRLIKKILHSGKSLNFFYLHFIPYFKWRPSIPTRPIFPFINTTQNSQALLMAIAEIGNTGTKKRRKAKEVPDPRPDTSLQL